MSYYLTREEAETIVGESAVIRVGEEESFPTNRLLDNPDEMEWKASIWLEDEYCSLNVYYITNKEDLEMVVKHDGDWGLVDWENRVTHYTVD